MLFRSSKEKFIEKMKQFGWNVNWTEKRKHITFQNQDGKKVRDSNLSKTFHLDISKEELENEFDRNRQKARDSAKPPGKMRPKMLLFLLLNQDTV